MTAFLTCLMVLLAPSTIALTACSYRDYRRYTDGFYLLSAVLALCSGTLATVVTLTLFGVDVP